MVLEGLRGGHDMMLGDAHIFKTGKRVGSLKDNSYYEGQTSCKHIVFFSYERAQLAGGSR